MPIYFHNSHEENHRSQVIVLACQIEGILELILTSYFKHIYENSPDNGSYTFEKLEGDLFSFNTGIMGGIFKANKTCLYLDLVEYEVSHDIDKLIKIRNAYAHVAGSGQLSYDDGLFGHIENTFFYKRNRAALKGLPKQDVLNQYSKHLTDTLNGYLS